jgi:hypothetical protein
LAWRKNLTANTTRKKPKRALIVILKRFRYFRVSRQQNTKPEKLSSKVNILGGHFGVVAAPHPSGTGIPMEYKGVEYSVVQLTDDTGWRWEVRFGDGKNKSGVTPVSRAFAIKLAEYEIDRTLKDRK